MAASPIAVTVEQFYRHPDADLRLELLAGGRGLDRIIREPTVNRPGLALTGFRKYFAPRRVQVLGNVETAYLRSLDPDARAHRYRELLRWKIPCVVLCRSIPPDPALMQAAEEAGIPLFQTDLVTMRFINHATLVLDELFAPRGQVHGCMVDIHGIGVVIQGESGIGKSEAVLGLLDRGYSLVADDITQLRVMDGRQLIGTGKAITRNLMEVRGIGIIDVAAMYGASAIRQEKTVDLVVVLKSWEQVVDVDRLGLDEQTTEMLGIRVPLMVIPVRPGRDMARLVEVAAFQTKLRQAGLNPARELSERLTAAMQLPPGS